MKFKQFIICFLMLSVLETGLAHAETAEFYYNLGREDFVNCNYHLAMENYNHALQLKPDYAEALNGRGEIYLNVSEYADAEREFSAAITANPKYYEAYVNRGRLYRTVGEYSRAIADWTKALELNPGMAGLREELADLYLCLGSNNGEVRDIAGAVRNLSLACLYDPGNAEAWYRLGMLYLYLGYVEEAEACFFEMRNVLEMGHEKENFFCALFKNIDSFFIHTIHMEVNYVL